ncbi:hypothetical protein [Methylotuvimicrobium alcaliphilum]|uniref:Uncharacterized protein n=1 Tax=Methylotuvimicrobium alcaliphilum (strain DSM 19304 / NCIMB 14124 / VKM B-2133 / 20Z) TaxID=1091494 RepID=G4SYA1_META2|nr:hypothetical protein [Methylotuvimicrobium alcaliphilum]CCE25410.1 protein of unknown function [Methylotuvimicrobium alcaliphilum 20Z]
MKPNVINAKLNRKNKEGPGAVDVNALKRRAKMEYSNIDFAFIVDPIIQLSFKKVTAI